VVDHLLPYYNRELAFLRNLSGEFAEAFPKVAGRLRLSADTAEDPHVSRLLEGVAFLNGRISAKLDDDFPELVDALLETLYPHYLAPVPSLAVAQFRCQPDLTGPYVVPKGAELDSEPVRGESCRFRTCYPAELWPITIENAALTGRPLVAPANPRAGDAAGSLRLSLRCLAPDMTFDQLQPDCLRFFLRGQPQQSFALYELLFNNTVSIALADGADDPDPVILPVDCLKPVGFASDEGLLPYPARAQTGYRLLTEFFTFPEKFLFFDLTGLAAKTMIKAGGRLEVFIYLNRAGVELERAVNKDNFALGCAPIVNLFTQRAEPIALDQTQPEYRVVPDVRRQGALEVYAVAGVTSADGEARVTRHHPFFGQHHAGGTAGKEGPYWTATRRPAGGRDPGTEVYLSLVDLDFDPMQPADSVATVETLCCNRDLPAQLPFGGGHPHLKPVQGAAAVQGISCLTPPTPTLRLGERRGHRRRLISHLSLNHLTISGGAQGLEALKEMLRLYDFRDSPETRAVMESLTRVESRRGTARAPARPGDIAWGDAMVRGLDITVEMDPARLGGHGLFLFSAVLDRFFALYCTINSFTRLTVAVKGRQGKLKTWPARAGERPLL
jgi:type VI secretion system protein ImpG